MITSAVDTRHWESCLNDLRKELRYIAKVPVYFAQAKRTGEIKIGFSTQVYSRLYLLGNQRFTQMDLLGWKRGGPAMERKMHAKFAHLSLGREWFEPGQELIDYIAHKTRHDEAPHIAPKYGRINDTHFDSLLEHEKHFADLIERGVPYRP